MGSWLLQLRPNPCTATNSWTIVTEFVAVPEGALAMYAPVVILIFLYREEPCVTGCGNRSNSCWCTNY